MTTLAIFDELVNSGFETNVLKTRENVIIQLARNHIKSRVLYQRQQLADIYSEVKSYEEIYQRATNVYNQSLDKSKDVLYIMKTLQIDMKTLYLRVINILINFQKKKFETEFPPNIFLWDGLRGCFNTEITGSVPELLLPNELTNQIKQLDIKYENFTRDFRLVVDKYYRPHLKILGSLMVFHDYKEVKNVLAKVLELDFDT
jgi:hypothetical protein